ncbi:MAG: hypothetical protein JO257_37345 [Deltaproteobacteria bacterium]|nr:hypothetical protein [Deltaproteobacteria bacterium]
MEALVGIAVGAAVFYVWIWSRFRGVGAWWKRAEQMKRFEQALRDAREAAEGPSPYRVARAETDGELLALLRIADSHREALESSGFRSLGDLVVERRGEALMVSRMLVSHDGVTLAAISVTRKNPTRVFVALSSYTGERQHATTRGEVPSLARPPFVSITNLPPDTSIEKLVAAHVAPEGARVTASIDDVLARLAELRERTVTWRASQSPDELLDADLRALLGKAYDKGGKMWAAKLRGKLPEARLQR